MDVKAYRQRVEAEIAKAATPGGSGAPRAAAAGIADKSAKPAARTAEIENAPIDPDNLGAVVEQLFEVLNDSTDASAVRLAALKGLDTAAFLGPRFEPYRARYMETLRKVAESPDAKLRESALEVLAVEKDPFAQDLLARGLKDAKAALVPLAKAIQLLAYDVHSDIVPLVRDVFVRAKGAAQEEALRLLASDPGSEKLFTDLLKDKSQKSAIRRLSATGLLNVNPEAFEKVARRIIVDDDDYDDIRATSLAALAHVKELSASLADNRFVKKVGQLTENTRSTKLRSSIRRFIETAQK